MTFDMPDAAASLQQEITDLEQRLQDAKARQAQLSDPLPTPIQAPIAAYPLLSPLSNQTLTHLHPLLLLSDSALPLGSFAYSSGLESFLAHHPKPSHNSSLFSHFLSISLAALASTTLPYVVAGYTSPITLPDLDNDLDASTNCTVARRASIKQGRALIAIWERCFRAHFSQDSASGPAKEARGAVEAFAASLKIPQQGQDDDFGLLALNGHLPPLFGALCAAVGIPLNHALYLYLLNHAKTVVSAAIRSSVMGPYQAQGVLASAGLQDRIWGIVEDEIGKGPRGTEEAGQSVPVLDLWGGRHEIIYSRIFNS